MSVVVIGLNNRSMPLSLFERLTVDGGHLPKALHDLSSREHVSEAVVLSTCNRTEVYAVAEKFHGAYQDIRNFLAEMAFLAPEDFVDHLFVHYDDEAVRHLFTVASGLDSAVLGDTEVLGQVKSAWERAALEGSTGSVLNLLFRHAIETGKRARTETGIARSTASVSHAAVEMASAELGSLAGRSVLVLGAGEMGKGMVGALRGAGVSEVLVANRTWERASVLAEAIGGRAVRLAGLPQALAGVDVLLTSTGATSMLVEHGDLAAAVGHRDGRPLLVVDIAVPRDVDPSAAELPTVTLLDMDDLTRFAERGRNERLQEVGAVEALVADECARYAGATSARAAAPLVSALRQRADDVRQAELDRFANRLGDLDPRQREAVEALTRGLMAKVLHEPSVRLKDLAGTPKGDRLAEALRDLYALDALDEI